jgi:hypothetical protein
MAAGELLRFAELSPVMKLFQKLLALAAFTLTLAAISGCASLSGLDPAEATSWGKVSSLGDPGPWVQRTFPGKTPNQFTVGVTKDGRPAVAVISTRAVSVMSKTLNVEPEHLGLLRFSWQLAELIAQADIALRDKDDAVRLVLAFDGDRSRLSARDHMLSELARTVTGEEMPYATLMYAWSNQHEVGRVMVSPRTDRIRKLVLESGTAGLGRWLDYERDIRADYLRVFGEEPGRLIGIGLMTDTDNTRSSAQSWYGPLTLVPAP